MNLSLKPIIITAVILAVLINGALSGVFNGDDTTNTDVSTRTEAPNPAVLQRIATLTDCDALQREFNTANAHNRDVEAVYMRAADRRMQTLGCYGD